MCGEGLCTQMCNEEYLAKEGSLGCKSGVLQQGPGTLLRALRPSPSSCDGTYSGLNRMRVADSTLDLLPRLGDKAK